MSELKKRIECAIGKRPCDLIFKNASVVDLFSRRIKRGDVGVCDGKIVGIGSFSGKTEIECGGLFLMPSFFDTHVHIESSMLTPAQYARAVAARGVTCVNADPHEIANVCGECGLRFMLESAAALPVDLRFFLPSCVPATPEDNGGAEIDAETTLRLLESYAFKGLGEMMNFHGLLRCDPRVLKKLETGVFVDGHAPRLVGADLDAYFGSGIKTDHECESHDEAIEKVSRGVYVQMREGSQTKNVAELVRAVTPFNLRRFVFCTDDRHICDILERGTVSDCIGVAVRNGMDPLDALTAASLNAYECYGIKNRGAIAPGYDADLVLAEDLSAQRIKKVFRRGTLIAEDGRALFDKKEAPTDGVIDTVRIKPVSKKEFEFEFDPDMPVIKVFPKTVFTQKTYRESGAGLNRCAVIERHRATGNVGVCFVDGFGLKGGAFAQTVGHDAHNITVIGDNAADMASAVNALGCEGGKILVKNGVVAAKIPLPVAGLMSDLPAAQVGELFCDMAKEMDTVVENKDISPFMLLSFLSLIVIPELKITDRGLFDVTRQIFLSKGREK